MRIHISAWYWPKRESDSKKHEGDSTKHLSRPATLQRDRCSLLTVHAMGAIMCEAVLVLSPTVMNTCIEEILLLT